MLLSATPAATFAQGAAPPNPRIALVIGESTYGDQTLATPVNDAALIAQTLQAAGFDVVGARDLDEKSVRAAMRDFLDKAAAVGPDMQAFVYLAGRGVQYEGDNFFVPVDAQLARDSDTPMEAVRIADFAHALASEPGRARILVLDAARANPNPGQGQPLAGGLALVDPDPGELVAFNAAPGSIAGDEQGPYGVYAKTLAGAMRQGGLPIEDVFAQTRVQVNQATGGAQVPWSAAKLSAPYYVFERAADAPPPPAVAAYADAANKPIRAFPADQAYSVALGRDTLPAYADFLAAYPNAPEARRVRAILAARREALFWRRAVAAGHAAGLLDLLAPLSARAPCRRRRTAAGDSRRGDAAAQRFRAGGLCRPAAAAAGGIRLRRSAGLRVRRPGLRPAAAPAAARLLRGRGRRLAPICRRPRRRSPSACCRGLRSPFRC